MPALPRVGIVCSGVLKEVSNPENRTLKELVQLVGSNTGNLAFTYPIDKLINNSVEVIPWDFDIELARERYDILWFACANMIGSHADLGWVADHLEKAGLPVIAIGLGAQNRTIADLDLPIQPGTLRWLDTLEKLSPSSCNIFCRGDYTDNLLKSQGISHSIPGCCPSLFISPDVNLGQTIFKNRHNPVLLKQPFTIYSGFIGNSTLFALEESLARLAHLHGLNGLYVSQHDPTLLGLSEQRFRETMREEDILRAKNMIQPTSSQEEFLQWSRRHMRAFYSLEAWLDEVKNFRFASGMRFHGNMISLQAGVPSLCISIDSRTEELCHSCQLPSMNAFEFSTVDPKTLYHVFDARYNPTTFDQNRSAKAAVFLSFLIANNLSPSLHLQKIAYSSIAKVQLPEIRQASPVG